MDSQNYKTLCPKVFDFCKILKIRELFLYSFILHKEKLITDRAIHKPQLKVEIEDGREALLKPSICIIFPIKSLLYVIVNCSYIRILIRKAILCLLLGYYYRICPD